MRKLGSDTYVLDTNGHSIILSNSRLILIDTGIKNKAEILLPEIEKAGYKPSDIQNIVITHRHGDHIGGLNHLQTLTDAKVAVHELDAPSVDARIDKKLKDEDIYEGLYVIHTPGHTEGSIALLDKEKDLLIAGDSFMNGPNGFMPMPDQYNVNQELHRKSIKKLLNYNFSKVIIGHGDPVEKNGHQLLSSLVNKHTW